ncbi:MAG: hypothetical protein COV46_03485 [Deltaproteobacteria bacterium CG11_big_fil_rev_8_21_14_0_20_49_13]|nr:MAG: hypothetical protein COV46_03485 [Deltaproteobacteria bacterium CG11_big_fil_rev_8_21_14_0_20_49_13]
MFDKLKQLKQLRDLQNQLGKEKLDIEKDGVKVTINGKMEVEEVTLNAGLDQGRQERLVKDCMNSAVKKMQLRMAERMSKMGGLGNLGL